MKESNLQISQDKSTIMPLQVEAHIAQLEINTTGTVTLYKGNQPDISKMKAVEETVDVSGFDVITIGLLAVGSYIAFVSTGDITNANLIWGRGM